MEVCAEVGSSEVERCGPIRVESEVGEGTHSTESVTKVERIRKRIEDLAYRRGVNLGAERAYCSYNDSLRWTMTKNCTSGFWTRIFFSWRRSSCCSR